MAGILFMNVFILLAQGEPYLCKRNNGNSLNPGTAQKGYWHLFYPTKIIIAIDFKIGEKGHSQFVNP